MTVAQLCRMECSRWAVAPRNRGAVYGRGSRTRSYGASTPGSRPARERVRQPGRLGLSLAAVGNGVELNLRLVRVGAADFQHVGDGHRDKMRVTAGREPLEDASGALHDFLRREEVASFQLPILAAARSKASISSRPASARSATDNPETCAERVTYHIRSQRQLVGPGEGRLIKHAGARVTAAGWRPGPISRSPGGS